MRFRGVASLIQERAQFWSGEQEKRGQKGREQGVVGEGAASLPPYQLGGLGAL